MIDNLLSWLIIFVAVGLLVGIFLYFFLDGNDYDRNDYTCLIDRWEEECKKYRKEENDYKSRFYRH